MDWPLNLQEGGRDVIWKQVGSSYTPVHYVPGFGNHSKKVSRVDPYAHDFFTEYFAAKGKLLEEVWSKWRYAVPKKTSAYRDVIRYRNPIQDPVPEIWFMCEDWASKHFSCMRESRIIWDPNYIIPYMNMHSSPGFPWNRGFDGSPAFKTKKELFAYQDGKFMKKWWLEYFTRISSLDYRAREWYSLSAKSELRKIKKIMEDKLRAYTAASWRGVMGGLAVCGDMNHKFYSSWETTSAFVGGSTFHGCWNKLCQRLNKHPNAFECDVTAWDSTLSQFMIESFSRMMWGNVCRMDKTTENKIRWDNIFKEIYQSVVICPNGDVFLKNQGNPSGHPFTIVTNTIIHFMLFCYAWMLLAPENLRSYEAFMRNVELALCGDDSWFTVSDLCVGFFNVDSITEIWLSLGIKAKVEAVGSGKLTDCNFLSQKTRQLRGGLYVPYPDTEKVLSSLIWNSNAGHHVRWSYLKACALRISSFFDLASEENEGARSLLSQFINHLETKFSSELRSHCTRKGMDMFTWEEVHSVYKTDRDLLDLFFHPESRGGLIDSPGLKLFGLDSWDKLIKVIDDYVGSEEAERKQEERQEEENAGGGSRCVELSKAEEDGEESQESWQAEE
jgi:hypothetical protein